MFVAITAVLALTVLNLLLVMYIKRQLARTARAYFNSPGMDKDNQALPSQFTRDIEYAGQRAGLSMAMNLKASAMQSASVDARHENKLRGAFEMDMLNQVNPLLGAAAKQWPEVGKYLKGNPGMAEKAMQMMGGFGGAKAEDNGEAETTSLEIT